MAISSSDEVLSVNSVQSNAGNPVWVLLAVIAVSAVYIVLMWKQICFCFKHFRDMGFEMYSQVASAVTGRLGDALGTVKDAISSIGSDGGSYSSSYTGGSTSSTYNMKGTGIMKDKPQDVAIKQSSGSNITVSQVINEPDDEAEENYLNPYNSGEDDEYADTTSASDIDAEIEAGKQMESDS